MVQKRQLFILVSQTNTGMARLIRGVSRYPYNHVSVTLDPSLRRWYSFARYVQDAPLFGGLVCESPERLCAPAEDIPVRLYRVVIPAAKALELERLLEQADKPESGLMYNHLDALASIWGAHVQLPECYTCLSFACEILEQEHLSISSLCEALEPSRIYDGPLSKLVPIENCRADTYFTPVGLAASTTKSAAQLGTLAARTIRYGFFSQMAQYFRRTAL